MSTESKEGWRDISHFDAPKFLVFFCGGVQTKLANICYMDGDTWEGTRYKIKKMGKLLHGTYTVISTYTVLWDVFLSLDFDYVRARIS